MKATFRIIAATATLSLGAAGVLHAQASLRLPQRMPDLAALGWSVESHLGQAEGQERMLVRGPDGQARIAVLHSYQGLLTYEKAPHPAER